MEQPSKTLKGIVIMDSIREQSTFSLGRESLQTQAKEKERRAEKP
jgi:hypothetical protein